MFMELSSKYFQPRILLSEEYLRALKIVDLGA